jgi:hypothetical protein
MLGFEARARLWRFQSYLNATAEHFLPPGIVPFPRGFAFGRDARLFLASGIGPSGEGERGGPMLSEIGER